MAVILINIKNDKEHPVKTLAQANSIIRNNPGIFRKKETTGASKEAQEMIDKVDAEAKEAKEKKATKATNRKKVTERKTTAKKSTGKAAGS